MGAVRALGFFVSIEWLRRAPYLWPSRSMYAFIWSFPAGTHSLAGVLHYPCKPHIRPGIQEHASNANQHVSRRARWERCMCALSLELGTSLDDARRHALQVDRPPLSTCQTAPVLY